MTGMGFEPTTPVFKRTKAFHALNRAATVIGHNTFHNIKTQYDDGGLYTACTERVNSAVTLVTCISAGYPM
jgi:hypothetical protein